MKFKVKRDEPAEPAASVTAAAPEAPAVIASEAAKAAAAADAANDPGRRLSVSPPLEKVTLTVGGKKMATSEGDLTLAARAASSAQPRKTSFGFSDAVAAAAAAAAAASPPASASAEGTEASPTTLPTGSEVPLPNRKQSDFGGSGSVSPPTSEALASLERAGVHPGGTVKDMSMRSYTASESSMGQARQASTKGKWFAVSRLASALSTVSDRAKKANSARNLISPEHVKAYHSLISMTKDIKGLHPCVDHPCQNIYWDFQTQMCLPGRIWEDTMPPEVRSKVDRDFLDDEVAKIEEAIHLHSAVSNEEGMQPRALFLIGPAAAGKSAVRRRTEEMLQIVLDDYVEIDGDEFREQHMGWMEVLKGDMTTGYKDALNVLLRYTRVLKKRILATAMEQRKNILLPSTGSNFQKLIDEAEKVRQAGYRVDVVGLVVSHNETRARALNRAHTNGRWNVVTKEKWESAMKAIVHFADPLQYVSGGHFFCAHTHTHTQLRLVHRL